MSLFNTIHTTCSRNPRSTPVTIEEFVDFGLLPKDYAVYIGLQHQLQTVMILNDLSMPNRDYAKEQAAFQSAAAELLDFCKQHNLTRNVPWLDSDFRYVHELEKVEAIYKHGWLRYPKSEIDFRLDVERRLSDWYEDRRGDYVADTFGVLSFKYEASCREIRIREYDPDTKELHILPHSEVVKLFDIARKEKAAIEKEFDECFEELERISAAQSVAALDAGRPMIKRLYAISEKQDIIEEVYYDIERAFYTQDLCEFKETDILYVYTDTNPCVKDDHLLTDVKVMLRFYGKPDKEVTVKKCLHCRRFSISLQEMGELFEQYGVPSVNIKYDRSDTGAFSDFSETSIFRDMGYTVSQAAGLSALQRQSILEHAITSKKVSKSQVLSFLEQRININGTKAGNEGALQKWTEDYEYIRKLR